jgi:hypothetical protein
MEQSIPIIATLAVIALFVTCVRLLFGGWSPDKVLQGIDKALLKSHVWQVFFLISLAFFVFAFLVSLGSIFNPVDSKGICFRFWSSLSHFLNPGSFYKTDGIHNKWIILLNLSGMVLMTGLLISVLSNLLERRVDNLKAGRIRYKFKNHILIIGYNKMAASLIKQMAKEHSISQVILQTIQDVPTIRHELFSLLDRNIEEKVIIVSGNRTSKEDLEKLYPGVCHEIYLFGESDEYDHDSVNIECLKIVAEVRQEKGIGKPVRCHVLFEYQSTYAVFQQQDIPYIKDCIDFIPFNFYESWAQKVFVGGEYTCLDREGITAGSDKHVHLAILGMSGMGVAMGIQAAHLCHFPNFITKGIKTRITFIDEYADREMDFLFTRYRHLFEEVDWFYEDRQTGERRNNTQSKEKFTDIEFEFIKGRVESPAIQNLIAGWATTDDKWLSIAVCFNYSPVAIAAGLYFPNEVYENNVAVFLHQEASSTIISMLSQSNKYRHVKPFGMLDDVYDLKKSDNLLPKMVKYVYDQTSKNNGKDIVFEKENEVENTFFISFDKQTIEDNWNRWEDNNGKDLKNITALKFSNIYNADMVKFKQRSLHIKPRQPLNNEQINLLARIEHNRWNIEKLLMGYRPCTAEETEAIEKGICSKQDLRDRFIHNDIKPYETLMPDDKGIQAGKYDTNISKALPYMLSEYEKQTMNTGELSLTLERYARGKE